MTEVRKRPLTAWRQAVAELLPDFESIEEIPADLLPALGAVAQVDAEVTVTIPAELAGAEQEIRRLLAEVHTRACEAATAHYGGNQLPDVPVRRPGRGVRRRRRRIPAPLGAHPGPGGQRSRRGSAALSGSVRLRLCRAISGHAQRIPSSSAVRPDAGRHGGMSRYTTRRQPTFGSGPMVSPPAGLQRLRGRQRSRSLSRSCERHGWVGCAACASVQLGPDRVHQPVVQPIGIPGFLPCLVDHFEALGAGGI